MKANRDLDKFVKTLPYASEIFGVYQPMIGWRSRRQVKRFQDGLSASPIMELMKFYDPEVDVTFSDNVAILEQLSPATLTVGEPLEQNDSLLLKSIARDLKGMPRPIANEQWAPILLDNSVEQRLVNDVFPEWSEQTTAELEAVNNTIIPLAGETAAETDARREREVARVQAAAVRRLDQESIIAKVIYDLFDYLDVDTLGRIFYGDEGPFEPFSPLDFRERMRALVKRRADAYEDPFLLFNPKKDIEDVSLSPLGIVHLFRQYFFEFDTFLGTPVGHIWLSPGASVELIETTSRRTLTERGVEVGEESMEKMETSASEKNELSEAVKQDNRNDTKLGITSTVSQSWATGSATVTASLNMDRTQQVARENAHKRMREQSEKRSAEIRKSYKSTFKTVTEVTDTSSKRYVLANNTNRLINYEMRRKMRQVGVQVQDVGTYLSWQTFVDDPGQALGLANLVHIAKPADLMPQPNQKKFGIPPRLIKSFEVHEVWDYDGHRRNHLDLGYIPLDTVPLPFDVEPGYEIEYPAEGRLPLGIRSITGEDAGGQRWNFIGRLVGASQIQVGVIAAPGGLKFDERIDYMLVGELALVPTAAEKARIEAANAQIDADAAAATREHERATQAAFHAAAKERIEQASRIKPRKFEDLRDEERTVVYRALIKELLTKDFYYLPKTEENQEIRHVLSELLDSIFDIDKMLYFVAPEWWKPRKHASQYLGKPTLKVLGKNRPGVQGVLGNELITNWSDNQVRPDNYYITSESEPARLGSSLGWGVQLDGDDHRNAFLNAPWVKAVIPIRPGKELSAMNWLKQVEVEGAAELDKNYAASAAELDQIRAELLANDPNDPVAQHPTIADGLRALCLRITRKHSESLEVGKFPARSDIHDDNKVSATPLEKVFEHGFYPLQGGLRVDPTKPDPNNPGSNFQVFDQWTEVLPTDQVVPVPVAYDPETGRQIDPAPPP